MNSTGPINKRYKPKYISGYESRGYAGDADSSFSQRLSNTYTADDYMLEEDEEIEALNELAIKASMINYNSRSLILEASGTNIIAENALIEMGKVALGDVIKNLLASGAVVLSGGLAGDTIVEILYAIERTKIVLDIIDSLKQGSKIVSNFFTKMENVKLENNLDKIKEISMVVITELASVYDDITDDASLFRNLKEIKESRKSVDLIAKVKDIFNQLREKMLEFAKASISAVADWISSFIPDDGGNVGTAIKTALVGAIEAISGRPYTTLKGAIATLPGEFSTLALSESKLEEYLLDMSNKIADAIEKTLSTGEGVIEKGVKGLASLETSYFDKLGEYTPLGYLYDKAGGAAQSAGDYIAGEDSSLGKAGKAMFDPRYKARKQEEFVDKAFSVIDQIPDYIRNTIIPMIPKAVDSYSRIMVYLCSFASLIESLSSGELEKFVTEFDPRKLTKKDKGNKELRGYLDKGSEFFTDALISREPKNQKAISESFKLIEFFDNSLNEEDDFEEDSIEEMSSGGVAGVATPLGTNSQGRVPSRKSRKNRLNHAISTFGGK
jgi:hypothetical protein